MMTVLEYLPWIIGLILAVGLLAYVWSEFRDRKPQTSAEDRYHQALELWLAGDLPRATTLLGELVKDHPGSVDPYLQLGILLRLQGDAERAAVLHRGLTVRRDLSRPKKVAAGLALAEDYLDLAQWEAAREILDDLIRDGSGQSRYWRARFRHWHGADNRPEAARALKQGARSVAENDRQEFQNAYAAYQLDRALEAVRHGDGAEARARLKDVRKLDVAQARERLVQAMLAASEGDPAEALKVASEDLLDRPQELALLMPVLQHVLLESGQFTRTVPMLERACQSENAPPGMWVELALIYEKLGERDKAFRLLESKAGSGHFNPDDAAPLLKILVRDNPTTDFARIWNLLDMPREARHWFCSECQSPSDHVRWFCPSCHAFDSFQARSAEEGVV